MDVHGHCNALQCIVHGHTWTCQKFKRSRSMIRSLSEISNGHVTLEMEDLEFENGPDSSEIIQADQCHDETDMVWKILCVCVSSKR